MTTLKADCRKFSPNVFNKSKCQNCFRTKDVHSAEALENNRASRNVSKCGYLFVAPDWDFNVSVNRTKRWQRRWFILYDDGELTYSLDEFPDTIPQGTIDMNKALDVSDAESITGNDFAIAITTSDKVHFIKGTSKEESKWWFDVLCRVLPRHLSRAKHKRNATFPCARAIPTSVVIDQEYCSEDDIRLNNYIRPKCLSSSEIPRKEWISSLDADEDVFPTNEDSVDAHENHSDYDSKEDVEIHNALNTLISQSEEIQVEFKDKVGDPASNVPKDCLLQLEELDARRRNRRYLKRENRVQRNQRSRSDGVSKMIPNKLDKNLPSESSDVVSNSMASVDKSEYLESIKSDESSPTSIVKKEPLIDSSTCLRELSKKTNLRKSESLKNIPSEMQSEARDHVTGLRRYHSFKSSSSLRRIKSSHSMSSLKKAKFPSPILPRNFGNRPASALSSKFDEIGKSDADLSMNSDAFSEHTSDGVFMRTGWLMRQTLNKDWSRHWFVVRDSSLTYYRDPSAEHSGIMDGIFDLNQVKSIKEIELDRYYAFSLIMWDDKKHVLATEAPEFRDMWMQALRYASNLWSSASKEDFIGSEIILPEHSFHHSDRSPSSLSSMNFVSDNSRIETCSTSSSDDQSEYFSLVDEDEISELSSSPRTLPPSPPINRNMMSLVKEKSRCRSNLSPKTSTPTTDAVHNWRNQSSDGHDVSLNRSFYEDTLDSFHTNERGESQKMVNGDLAVLTTKPTDLSSDSQSKHPRDLQLRLDFDEHYVKKAQRNGTSPSTTKSFRCQLSSASTTPSETPQEQCLLCLNVKSKLAAAKEEIRRLKKELKEAHANFDNLEVLSYKLTQDIKAKEEDYVSQIALMTAKIDDLTSKYTLAEKNYRQLKQKTAKSDGKERKRSSLKNREGLSITKEYELKLCDLEKKIGDIETSLQRANTEISSDLQSDNKHNSEDNNNEDVHLIEATKESLSNDTKGFFSRLQSLGSKVQDINNLVLDSAKAPSQIEGPEIRLEVKDVEESSLANESDDSWALTFDNTLKNLNKYLERHPSSLLECQMVFNKKVNKVFKWLKSSLVYICKQENIASHIVGEKFSFFQNIISVLDTLLSESLTDSQEATGTSVHKTFLASLEIMKFLERLDNVDSISSLVKSGMLSFIFKAIVKTLCLAFSEYENPEISVMFQIVSSIPHIYFFCPLIRKFVPNPTDSEKTLTVSDRLDEYSSQITLTLEFLSEAKKIRYESLWNTLNEVPVQDANLNKPKVSNSIVNYVTSLASDVYRIAELQLLVQGEQPLSFLQIENDKILSWTRDVTSSLKLNLLTFLEELSLQCPMIQESTVSLSDLSGSTRQELTSLLLELSFLSVIQSLISSVTSFTFEGSEGDGSTNPPCLSSEWIQNLRDDIQNRSETLVSGEFFECLQCSAFNNMRSSPNHSASWTDYIERYKTYNSRKHGCLGLEVLNHVPNSNGVNASSKCSFPEPGASDLVETHRKLVCTECENWSKKLEESEKQHEGHCQDLKLKFHAELRELEDCLIKSSEIHEHEMMEKENELKSAASQLQQLKAEYENQKEALKNLYEQKLNSVCNNVNESNIRNTYKAEIDDIKELFKKGLEAIERSHYRITNEMEKRHQEEIAILKAEKERALDLETKATITALEAIKKSHEQKLKEETLFIRDDLMRKFQFGEQDETFYSKYGNELESLKAEIVNITDRYSKKCQENFTLEEKVDSLRHQLEEAHDELCALLKRNKEMDLSLLNV